MGMPGWIAEGVRRLDSNLRDTGGFQIGAEEARQVHRSRSPGSPGAESLGKGLEHFPAHLETRGTDSGPDRRDEVFRAASVADQPPRAIPRKTREGPSPAAVGQDRPGPGAIRHHHGKTVGVPHQGGIPGFQQEGVAGRRFPVLVDDGSVFLRALADRPGTSQAKSQTFEIRRAASIEIRSIQKAADAPAGDAAGPQEREGERHPTWMATSVRSSWLWAPAENSFMSFRSEARRSSGGSSTAFPSDRVRRSIP